MMKYISSSLYQVFTTATKLPLVSCFYQIGTLVAKAMGDLNYVGSVSGSSKSGAWPLSCFCNGWTSFFYRVCAQARFHLDEPLLAYAEFVLISSLELVSIDTMADSVKVYPGTW